MDEKLNPMRHSLAHILASAVQHLWPHAKFGVGPVVENGFYYDIDLGKTTVSEEDFKKIEAEMQKIIAEDQPIVESHMNIDDAIKWSKDTNQPYKEELLNDLKRAGTTVAKDLSKEEMGTIANEGEAQLDKVSFYTNGDFTDLCLGPHVESTAKVGAFKLMRVAGAYWRGSEANAQMQRIYGVAFENEKDLKKHLQMLEEAKKRDHRKLGEKLQMFFITDDVGAGLPLMMPRGERVKRTLMEYMREKEENLGYQYVATPVLSQEQLYQRSGHAEFFADDMYATAEDAEGHKFYLAPMNCPHHHMIFERMVDSYRDLPLKLSEHAGLYRYELSGALSGLIRMRGPITQNDSHTYVTRDQLKEEFKNILDLFVEVYRETGIEDFWFRLSLPDFEKDKFAQNQEMWNFGAEVIREVLVESKLKFVEAVGDAAFYGPKLDVQTKNVVGKEDTIATVQVDILMPERMDLTYVDEHGEKQYPFIIHKSIMGAFERFFAFLLEKTAGNLPVWLSPEQVRVVTVNQEDETVKFAKEIMKKAKKAGLYTELDNDNESVGKKIRGAEIMKVPYTLVIGEKEIKSGNVSPRVRKDLGDDENQRSQPVDDFIAMVANQKNSRTL